MPKAIPFQFDMVITTIKKVKNRFTNIPNGKLEIWGKGVVTVDHLADPELMPSIKTDITIQSIMYEAVDILPILQSSGCKEFMREIDHLCHWHLLSVIETQKQ